MKIDITLFEGLLMFYILVNGISTGFYMASEMSSQSSPAKQIWFIFYLLFGSLIWLALYPVLLIWEFLKEYLWPDITFYYSFLFTDTFEKMITEENLARLGKTRLQMLDDWNLLQFHFKGYTRRRLARHARVLNKRFNFTFEPKWIKTGLGKKWKWEPDPIFKDFWIDIRKKNAVDEPIAMLVVIKKKKKGGFEVYPKDHHSILSFDTNIFEEIEEEFERKLQEWIDWYNDHHILDDQKKREHYRVKYYLKVK